MLSDVRHQRCAFLPSAGIIVLSIVCCAFPKRADCQVVVTPLSQMTLDSNALILAAGGNFSDIINGSPFQQEALTTHQGYQYTAWYHNGVEQDIYIARRDLNSNVWETVDTGYNMENGNENWDSHNVISMGISGDGRIHLAYDHHVHQLRYLATDPGVATSSGGAWNQAMFQPERSALNQGGASIPRVTYPRFANVGDDLVFTYRDYGSGNGDHRIADYDSQTGQWSNTRFVTKGRSTSQIYDDANNNPSNNRNSYHNGFHADATGRLHTTWTWREGTQDGNHDIMYAYSDDKGVTWRNNADQLVGSNSAPITLNSIGVEVIVLDRRQALLNQQGQIVDASGGVHVLMFHRRQEPGFEWQPGDGVFSHRPDSAYYHYYRDPLSGAWDVNQLPLDVSVGSRPRIGVDGVGNLFGLYTSGDDLIIAGAEKHGNEYSDWEILYRDKTYDYEGTPLLDTVRLAQDGILSVFIQEKGRSSSPTIPTGSPLHVLEFSVSAPAVQLFSDVSDGSLRSNKSTGEVSGEGLGFVINSEELNVGQSGSSPTYDRAAVLVFQLPDLGSIDNPFQAASFQAFLTQSVMSEGFGGDLYGLSRRDTPEILNTDYYGQKDPPDLNAVLLQDDLLVANMEVNAPVLTSTSGSAQLVDFLNAQYAGGAGIGDYVFLRLNVDASTTQRWSLFSGNAGNDSLKPHLIYRAVAGEFLNGDYNRDGVVNLNDYAVWRDHLGAPAGTLPNDPGSGTIGIDQYNTWRANFGRTFSATSTAAATRVPEPASCLLTILVFSMVLASRYAVPR